MRVSGEDRQKKLDKRKTKYPPARALPIVARHDPKAEQRRIARIVQKARRG